ncbi:MAG: EcsC family protein [Verrucomicrobiales bacterium]|nr:EcsC family protein [Verrucomicrobiales bacterium]
MDPQERADLLRARALLQTPGVAVRFANLLGAPIEKGFRLLPSGASRLIHRATRSALQRALGLALHSLGQADAKPEPPDNRLHRWMAGASGAVGGAFGFAALAVELPISTTLILRSIAQIAASQGHDLASLETRLACLEVFALGGQTSTDNAAETSYWAVRAALAKVVTEALGSLAGRSAITETAPAAVRLVTSLASRFGVVVSEQVAAKAVPVLGAAAGAAINVVFMDHFQRMAEGHFILKRLEQRHGTRAIRRLYETLHAHP